MIKDLMRGLLASILVFVVLAGVGWLILDQTTSPSILDRSVTQIAPQATDASDPFAVDATTSSQGQFDTYLEDIADGLLNWIIWISVLGGVASLAWFGWSTFLQRKVVGPSGQNDAFSAWALIAAVYFLSCLAVYFWDIAPLGISDAMDDTVFFSFIAFGVALGLLSYWVATGIAATPVMKPSVPFAARKRHG